MKAKKYGTLSEAAKDTGLSVSGLRKAYHSKSATMTRKDGKVFNLEWKKLVEFKFPEKITNFCAVCSTPISFKDKIYPFQVTKLNRFNEIEDYRFSNSIIDASRWSGVSVNVLRNACEKGNPKVTRRKGGTQTYWIRWRNRCFKCHYIARTKVSEETYNRTVEKIGEEELKRGNRKAMVADYGTFLNKGI